MISVPVPVRAIVQADQLNIDVIIINSPMRFGRGGRARLARFARNHQVVVKGKIIWRPRARIMVRLCIRS